MFITERPIIKLWEEDGGRVPCDTSSRRLCGLVQPPRTAGAPCTQGSLSMRRRCHDDDDAMMRMQRLSPGRAQDPVVANTHTHTLSLSLSLSLSLCSRSLQPAPIRNLCLCPRFSLVLSLAKCNCPWMTVDASTVNHVEEIRVMFQDLAAAA